MWPFKKKVKLTAEEEAAILKERRITELESIIKNSIESRIQLNKHQEAATIELEELNKEK